MRQILYCGSWLSSRCNGRSLHFWCWRWTSTVCFLNCHTAAWSPCCWVCPVPSICTEPPLVPLWCKSGHFISLLKYSDASHFTWVNKQSPSKWPMRLYVMFLITVLDRHVLCQLWWALWRKLKHGSENGKSGGYFRLPCWRKWFSRECLSCRDHDRALVTFM